ncbi:Hypothetical predicted protein [Cloeon dipterum]|uniref:Uncharacterized protein n=1 Tax=Cloeon dipterum TaxID=197152 RepID=A0A8S1CRG3_9INSE|nr:Hypothetical predicted protein [Cloeon dipterum]
MTDQSSAKKRPSSSEVKKVRRKACKLAEDFIREASEAASITTTLLQPEDPAKLAFPMQLDEEVSTQEALEIDFFPSEGEEEKLVNDSEEEDNVPDCPHEIADEENLISHQDQEEEYNNFQTNSEPSNMREFLQKFCIQTKIPRTHVNLLLKGMKRFVEDEHHVDLDLPADYRSLLKTPRETNLVVPAGIYGHFSYLGIENGIRRVIKSGYKVPNDGKIQIKSFVDGFCPQNKCNKKFIAILNSITDDPLNRVFLTGIYCGSKNPEPFGDILIDFVDEYNSLLSTGFQVDVEGSQIDVFLQPGGAFILDIPAKADVKNIKHTGYSSCDKCTSRGKWLKGIFFPELKFTARSDESFRSREDNEHHLTGRSAIEALFGLDMVVHFVNDYLHLVLLGTTKRLLRIYLLWPKSPRKLNHDERRLAVACFDEAKLASTKEFQWEPSDLLKFETFNAKEMRFLLLYAGFSTFRNAMQEKDYENFLNLSLAIRILCSEDLVKSESWLMRAEKLLYSFVYFIKHEIGARQVVRVVHGLLHLVEDARVYGALDKFSAFYFESFLGNLGKMVPGPKDKLRQMVNRYLEEENVAIKRSLAKIGSTLVLGKKCSKQPAPPFLSRRDENHFEFITYRGLYLATTYPNNVIITKGGNIVKIVHILAEDRKVRLVGNEFVTKDDLFDTPFRSSHLDIYFSPDSKIDSNLMEVKLDDLHKKCVHFKHENESIFVPILHH